MSQCTTTCISQPRIPMSSEVSSALNAAARPRCNTPLHIQTLKDFATKTNKQRNDQNHHAPAVAQPASKLAVMHVHILHVTQHFSAMHCHLLSHISTLLPAATTAACSGLSSCTL